MNQPVDHAALALSLYETACETHKRQDWRLACHALAKSLKQSLARSAAMPAPPAPAPVEAVQVAPVVKAKAKGPAKAPDSFNMTAGSLAKALRILGKVTEKRVPDPKLHILLHSLLTATGDHLVMTATDLDVQITVTVEAPGIGEWETTAPTHDLLATVSKMPRDSVVTMTPETAPAQLAVICGASRVNLPSRLTTDYPHFNEAALKGAGAAFYMPQDRAADALAFVSPSISTEETRYYLNGVYMHAVQVDGENRLRFVTTDGHRMASWDMPAPPVDSVLPGVIIPDKAVTIAQSIIPHGDGRVLIWANAMAVEIKTGPFSLLSKVIDGSFPDYNRVIPRANEIIATIPADTLASIGKECKAFTGVKLSWGYDRCAFEARSILQSGEAVTASGAHPGGLDHDDKDKALEIGFNPAYLADAGRVLAGHDITFAMADPASPTLLKPVREDGDTRRLVVLMPLRV